MNKKKKRMKCDNSKYCPLAWTHSFINHDGTYQVCCTSEEYDNNITDDKGQKISIKDNYSSQEVMNTNFMKRVRLDLIKGKWPKFCNRCRISELNGGVSRRKLEIMNFKDSNEEFLEGTLADGTVGNSIRSADYRLGNTCNLQCRMCNPASTKLWIREWRELKPGGERIPDSIMNQFLSYDWIDSPEIILDLKEKSKTLTHIHFAGGEPMLAKQMGEFLRICIDSGNSKNITITYNTNGTLLPENITKLWKYFKGIKLLVSIDATKELNSYIRHPSKWESIDKTLQSVEENYKDLNIIECMVSTTVQILNVLYLETLYQYLSQFSFIVPVPNLVNLHTPTYFRTSILPAKLKIIASLKLNQIREKYQKTTPEAYLYLIENINEVISFMDKGPGSKKDFEEFIKFQATFDKSRKLSLSEVAPEFKNY
jgi:molybdenum cofactor biosynthesis enzyme MoaA